MARFFLDKVKSFAPSETFIPKSFQLLKKYTLSLFLDDLRAGINVGCISLPLAMAFAIGSGVAPERGLYTAIVAGFLISLFGGSRMQIGGPTGAYIVLIYSTVQKHGYEGLALATLLAGIFLMIAGFFRLGTLIRFIPYPVTTGFTAGIATVIFVSQIKDFAGFAIDSPSVFFFEKILQYVQNVSTLHSTTLGLASVTLLIILSLRKISKKIPAFIIASVIVTLLCSLYDLPVRTIENSFGSIPHGLLWPAFPNICLSAIQAVFADAVAIALLGGIESLLSCIVADNMTGFRHKSNCELVGQGIANIASSLCGGIPATGAIARTGANIQSGAKTPVSGMIHALTVLLLMLLFAKFASKMPLCVLSAILMVVAYNMSEIEHIKKIFKGPRSDQILLVCTYILTVCVDLTFAVQVSACLAAFFFLKKMTEKSNVTLENVDDETLLIKFNGPFFFAIADKLNDALTQANPLPKKIVLECSAVSFIDATALQALNQFQNRCQKLDIALEMIELKSEISQTLMRANVMQSTH